MEYSNGIDGKGNTIAIIGIGLIGSSLAAKIRAKNIFEWVIGVETNPAHCEIAFSLQLVDEMCHFQEAINKANVIVLSVPVDCMLDILPQVLDAVTDQIVLDTGSTKREICEKVNYHPARGRFVASHPMWGSEVQGPGPVKADAFENKVAVICDPHRSDPDALLSVCSIYESLGMRIIEMESEEHDIHTAYISHLPHVISFALANTILIKEREKESILSLASGGFNSAARLAKGSSGMWSPIFDQNKDNILSVLDEYLVELGKFRACLEMESCKGICNLIEHANAIRKVFV